MKLYWSPRSPYVRKVMVVAHETGLVHRIECIPCDVFMMRENEVLMRVNPFSKIPTLVLEDGRVFNDSAFICEYLDSLHAGPKLFPPEGEARWRALSWHAKGDAMLDALILWRNERDRPEGERSARLIRSFETRVHTALDGWEREVASIADDAFNVGHITLGVALGYLDFRFNNLDWRAGRKALTGWHARFASRDSAMATEPRLA
jgi:glutathione S-transferase